MFMKLFRKPTASERAAQELQAAKLERLQAQAAAEYWRHTCAMLEERIVRLEYATGSVSVANFKGPIVTREHMHGAVKPTAVS